MDMTADIIGYLGLIVTLVSFSLAKDENLQIINLVGCLLWAVHFGVMEEWSAFVMLLVASGMVGSSIAGDKALTNALWMFNILLIPVMSMMILGGGAGWYAILPVLGGFFINTGVAKCSGNGMTFTIMAGLIVWVVAAVMMGSLPAILANLLNLAALIIRECFRMRKASGPADSGALATGTSAQY